MKRRWCGLLLLLAACGDKKDESVLPVRHAPPPPPSQAERRSEPGRVRFDHVLIAFEGATKSRARRTREQARALAYRLYDGLRAGTAFLKTKNEFTDDRSQKTGAPLGPYVLVNFGLPYKVGEFPRSHYAKDLADKLFAMKVGETALVDYHPKNCPFGYHILMRLE